MRVFKSGFEKCILYCKDFQMHFEKNLIDLGALSKVGILNENC